MDNIFETREYKRSRAAYMVQCTVEYFVSCIVADAFLAKLLTYLGFSDALTGIISSFVTLAFLFQLLSVFLVKVMKNTKRTVIFFDSLSQIFFMSIYIVPFLGVSREIKTLLVVVAILAAYILKYLVIGVYFKWANSFVEPTKRATYSAKKEMISLITGIVFTLSIGYTMDKFEAAGNVEGSFIFLSAVLLILNISNFISLVLIARDKTDEEAKEETTSIRMVAKYTFQNKNFVNVIILGVIWDVGRYASVGFLGTFKTNDLLMTMGTVQVINMISNIARFFLSIPFGRFSDKTSFATGIKVALIVVAIGFGFNMFTTPKSWWCIVVYTLCYNVGLAGLNQNMFNISYNYVPKEYFVQAMAIKNSIGGILGFVASLLAGRFMEYMQSGDNMIFGMHLYGQQILSGVSLVMMIGGAIFVHKVIEKQKVMIQ